MLGGLSSSGLVEVKQCGVVLTDAQVQMARELGMNPQKLGKIDNHRQERWKAPLPQFIEHIYFKNFGKRQPDRVVSIEERAREVEEKRHLSREQRTAGHEPPMN
jgi:hypothetical protein